jgi:iron complex outermembrane receptor protein
MRRGQFRVLWLLSAATVVVARPVLGQDEPGDPLPTADERQIVVIGQRPEVFVGITPETELDENDIAAYGFNSIGDLIQEISREVDPSGEGPVVLLNGQLTNGINDIADLPTEAASQIQVLPSTVSARLGQSPSRRVINVVIKSDLAQITGNVETGLATRGDAWRGQGEINLLKLDDGNRRSVVFRAQRADGLLEKDRGILPDTTGTPFDTLGNVIGFAGFGTEIDPALSALAGMLVTVAGVPVGVSSPTLAQFAANANRAHAGGGGAYRSLADAAESYSLNGNITERLDADTTISSTARLERSYGDGLNGLFAALLRVPTMSPFSPFGSDVSLAAGLGEALRHSQVSTALNAGSVLHARVDAFNISASVNYAHRVARTETDRDYDLAALQAGVLAGGIDPFAGLGSSQIGPVRTDRSRARSDVAEAQVVAGGPLLRLPTGLISISMRLGGRLDHFSTFTRGATVNRSSQLRRDDINAQANLQIPVLPAGGIDIGSVTVDLTGGVRRVSGAGTLESYGGAINWAVTRTVDVRFELADEEVPTLGGLLTDPVIVSQNYRVFDFIRQETVLVDYVTGGNPDLLPQHRRVTKISGTAVPLPSGDLTFNAEYNRIVARNSVAQLPPANSHIQAAFPDRFIRDASGVLVQLDARPVSFVHDKVEFVRWSLDLRHTYGARAGTPSGNSSGASMPSVGGSWRLDFRVDHSWYLTSERLARQGLAPVDLLAGGAAGYGGGQQRHQVQVSASAFHRGMGLQVFGDWNSRSVINAGTLTSPSQILFAPRLKVNTRMFANLGPLFPQANWLKGARVTLEVVNLLDSKQRVTDQGGGTPLRYQPFLLDPVGRAFKLTLRKVL